MKRMHGPFYLETGDEQLSGSFQHLDPFSPRALLLVVELGNFPNPHLLKVTIDKRLALCFKLYRQRGH